jgi:hypothetical protein
MSPKLHYILTCPGNLQELVNIHGLSLREVRELNQHLALPKPRLCARVVS